MEAGYKPAKAGCLALKSVFVIFFLKTTFWRAKYKNNQREPGPSNRVTTMFPNYDFYIAGLFQDE